MIYWDHNEDKHRCCTDTLPISFGVKTFKMGTFQRFLTKRVRHNIVNVDTRIRGDAVIGNRNHTEERGLSSGVENCAARGDV